MGFCRTNLFKRLESSGQRSCCRSSATSCATTSSCTRWRTVCPCPSAPRTPRCWTPRVNDEDTECVDCRRTSETSTGRPSVPSRAIATARTEVPSSGPREVYADYAGTFKTRFKWLPARLFLPASAEDLRRDAKALHRRSDRRGPVASRTATPSSARLLSVAPREASRREGPGLHPVRRHGGLPGRATLRRAAWRALAGVTGDYGRPHRAGLALQPGQQREAGAGGTLSKSCDVLIATDVLSEGQNLQDAASSSTTTCRGPSSA